MLLQLLYMRGVIRFTGGAGYETGGAVNDYVAVVRPF